MTRARNSANLASHGNLFVDITNDRTGIGSVVPGQSLHVAGTAGFHGDVTFTGDLYNTTWDRSDNSLKFVDNAKVKFGTGGDLEVYHDGTDSVLLNLTGKIRHRSQVHIWKNYHNNQTLAKFSANGAAELYHTNSKKFETTAYGTNITGTTDTDGLVVSGVATVTTMNVTGVLTYDDVTSVDSVGIVTARQGVVIPSSNKKLAIGPSGNLELMYSSTHGSQINTADAGDIRFRLNSSTRARVYSAGFEVVGKILTDSVLEHRGDSDTSIGFSAADTIDLKTGGTTMVGITTRTAISSHTGSANAFGQLSVNTSGTGDGIGLYIGAYAAIPSTHASGNATTGVTTAIYIQSGHAKRPEIRFHNTHNGNWHDSPGNTSHLRMVWTTPESSTTPEVVDIHPRVVGSAGGAFDGLRIRVSDNSNGLRNCLFLQHDNQYFYVNNSTMVQISSDGLGINDSLYHRGDTNTKIRFPTNDQIQFETAGTSWFNLGSTGAFQFGNNSNAGAKVYIKNGNDDANNTNALALDIQGAWMRIGDAILGNQTYNNGVGIKFHNSGTVHWTAGILGSGFYISNTSGNGNQLFPSSRTDAFFLSATGNATFSGNATVSGNLSVTGTTALSSTVTIPDSLQHDGDTNTKIRFPAADTFSVETAGSERLRIKSDGKIGIGNFSSINPARAVHIHESSGGAVYATFTNSSTGTAANNGFTIGVDSSQHAILNNYSSTDIRILCNGSERLRIDNAGRLSLGVVASPGSYPVGTQARQVQAEIKGGISGNNYHHGSLALNCTNNNSNLHLVRSDNNQNADVGLGNISFSGYDGSDFHVAAQISGRRDAAGGNNDVPGRLVFLTTADGASQPTERLRINSSGHVVPGADSTYDLGLTGTRFRNVYADALYGDGSNLTGIDADKIQEGNSYAEILDTGTNGIFRFLPEGNEVFRIDSDGRVLIGTTSGSDALVVDAGSDAGTILTNSTNSNGNMMTFQCSGTSKFFIGSAGSFITGNTGTANQGIRAEGHLLFATGGHSERLRIDSSGRLLIGTTSGSQGQVSIFNGNDFNTASISNTTDNIFLISDATSGNGVYGASIGFSRVQYNDRRAAAIVTVQEGTDEDNVGLAFFTHPAANATDPIVEALRISSSGQLLVGTTSSSYHFHVDDDNLAAEISIDNDASNYKTALNTTNSVNADFNVQHKANLTSIGTGVNVPLCFHINGGTNAISAEKMRLTADLLNIKGGNLHVGTDSATANFTDSNNGNTKHIEIGATNNGDALLTTHASGYGIAYFGYEAGGDRCVVACDDGGGNNKIDFITNAGTSTGGNSDNLNGKLPKMRVKSGGGGVQIFVHESATDFQPKHHATALLIQNGHGGGDIGPTSEPTHIDWHWVDSNTNVTPQCRISGNVGNGGDPNSLQLEGKGFLTFHCSDTAGTSGDHDPGQRLRIAHNGTFTGSSSNNISDQRLKENIATITDPIAKIKALKGRTFTWKTEASMREGTHYGFIAQEIETVIPELIVDDTGIRIFDKDDNLLPNNVYTPPVGGGYAKSVDADGVTPVLVEALKEALAKIEVLEAKVAALEG